MLVVFTFCTQMSANKLYSPYFHMIREKIIDFYPTLHPDPLPPFQLVSRYLQERLESQNSQITNQEAIKY